MSFFFDPELTLVPHWPYWPYYTDPSTTTQVAPVPHPSTSTLDSMHCTAVGLMVAMKPIWDNLLEPAISDPGGGASTCLKKLKKIWSPDISTTPHPPISKPNTLLQEIWLTNNFHVGCFLQVYDLQLWTYAAGCKSYSLLFFRYMTYALCSQLQVTLPAWND